MGYISIENLSFAYDGSQSLVLENVSMSVAAGEFVCLLGQSGCGKSTFLRLLAGLEKPTVGTIAVDGKHVAGTDLERSVVFQDYGLFPWITAGDNITLAIRQKFPKKSKREAKPAALEWLKAVGLDESVFDKFPKELSGGMKQRCAIARSFSIDPPILLMDEPFGALDAVTRAKLQDMALKLWHSEENKKTIFFVTHDVDEALLLASRIYVFGQSPSAIIFSCDIPKDKKPERSDMYKNAYVMKMRHELIEQINRDVAQRVNC